VTSTGALVSVSPSWSARARSPTCTPGMPVGTPGVQVGLRARADHEGETLTSAPVEVTLVEPTAAAVAAPAPDAGALITAREQMRKAVAP